jgi:hypothetical protein
METSHFSIEPSEEEILAIATYLIMLENPEFIPEENT